MPIKKEIIYPVFLECNPYINDIFWEGIFEDLSYGKPPSGSYISKGFLCCSYKGKEFSYKIERKDPKILHDEVYGLLTKKLGILSHKEKVQKRIDFHQLEQGIKESRHDWARIRKKNIKDTMYEQYVLDMKKKHNFSIEKCRYLLAVILLSVMFKTITTKDIIYENDKIQDIIGIEFIKNKKHTDIVVTNPLFSNSGFISKDIIEKTAISNEWPKFLDLLKKMK